MILYVFLISFVTAVVSSSLCHAETYKINKKSEWEKWSLPRGVVQLTDDGRLELRRYRKFINAIADAKTFVHKNAKGNDVRGGLRSAGSGATTAELAIDGDTTTYWKPDPKDQLEQWTIDIDLGRAIMAKKIRLTFPDKPGGRPFRQFSVFVANGARIKVSEDIFTFDLVWSTTRPNAEQVIEFPLFYLGSDTTQILDPGLDITHEEASQFRLVQYIRFLADGKTPDAALAEIEVEAWGDNLGLGFIDRGGSTRFGLLFRDPQNALDGDPMTHAALMVVQPKAGWRETGSWFEIDLGSLFWIDQMMLYFKRPGEGTSVGLGEGFISGPYAIIFSDGKRTLTGEIDYEPLIDMLVYEPNVRDVRGIYYHFNHLFKPRKIRYLFLFDPMNIGWFSQLPEMQIFSPGYPAEVTVQSGFIDLGAIAGDNRPKNILSIDWNTVVPPRTKMLVRSRSGDTLVLRKIFYHRSGEQVSEDRWNKLPTPLRGKVVELTEIGDDWSSWSNFYQASGESFQSPSPRRYAQLEIILSSDDPGVAPIINALHVNFTNSLLKKVSGIITPRSTEGDRPQTFTYTIFPTFSTGDRGYDRVMLRASSAEIDRQSLQMTSGETGLGIKAVSQRRDSLIIDLTKTIQRDTVEVRLTARIRENGTILEGFIGNTKEPGLWQSIDPAVREATTITLPGVVGTNNIIGNLSISPRLFTPNGDGINDAVEINFSIFKVEKGASVEIYTMAGERVARLVRSTGGNRYLWDGRNEEGEPVPPGTYLCRIHVDAQTGVRTQVETIGVVY